MWQILATKATGGRHTWTQSNSLCLASLGIQGKKKKIGLMGRWGNKIQRRKHPWVRLRAFAKGTREIPTKATLVMDSPSRETPLPPPQRLSNFHLQKSEPKKKGNNPPRRELLPACAGRSPHLPELLYVRQELSYLNSPVCSGDHSLAQKCHKKAFLTVYLSKVSNEESF